MLPHPQPGDAGCDVSRVGVPYQVLSGGGAFSPVRPDSETAGLDVFSGVLQVCGVTPQEERGGLCRVHISKSLVSKER